MLLSACRCSVVVVVIKSSLLTGLSPCVHVNTGLLQASGVTRWVSPGAATEGITPTFFLKKTGDLFAHQYSGVTPPLYRVTPHLFTCPTSVRPCLSTIPCKFAHKFFLRVSPPGQCHPRRSTPVTPLFQVTLCSYRPLYRLFDAEDRMFVMRVTTSNHSK